MREIKKGEVYRGMYFVSYAVMALEDVSADEIQNDDFEVLVKVYDLNQARERYVSVHQLEKMPEEYAREYVQSELESVYPGWNEYVEEKLRGCIYG